MCTCTVFDIFDLEKYRDLETPSEVIETGRPIIRSPASGILLASYINFVSQMHLFTYSHLASTVTLKPGLEVTPGQ